MADDTPQDEFDAEVFQDAPPGAVVVGIDGQEHDATVVAWAVDEAASRQRPLHVQEVVDLGISLMAGEGYLPMTSLPPDSVDEAGSARRAATDVASARRPDVPLTSSSVPGSVAGVLVSLSENAACVVVGGGGVPGKPFLGSTALSVAAHAKCPTIVLPDTETAATGKVVVGVDGSKQSRAAARFAFDYAARHGASVTCLISWSVEMVDGCVVTTPGSPEWIQVEEKHAELVERVIGELRGEYPQIEVEVLVRRGRASALLVEAADDAELLVIGSRGRGGFLGMLLGSTSKRVLEEATRPVAVLHA